MVHTAFWVLFTWAISTQGLAICDSTWSGKLYWFYIDKQICNLFEVTVCVFEMREPCIMFSWVKLHNILEIHNQIIRIYGLIFWIRPTSDNHC